MRTWSSTLVLLSVLAACKGAEPPPQISPIPASTQPAPAQPNILLSAAGVSLPLPSTWTIVHDKDPDFALAHGPGEHPPTCTIEVRRQGIGKPPQGAKRRDEGEFDFTRGALRGRVRTLAGPSESAKIVMQCLAPKAAQWAAIEAAFDSQSKALIEPVAPPSASPIAQLCTGTPAHQTYVCVRRDDGAVYCGASDGDALARVVDIEPSVQIACEGMRACSRAASGDLRCWKADDGAQPVAEITQVRDLAGGCVVDAGGKASCRQREASGATSDRFAELLPFGDAAFALGEVDHVLPGSGPSQGCVLTQAQLRCWDRTGALRLPLPDNTGVHTLAAPALASDLAMIGGRVCIAAADRWTCLDGAEQFELDDCERRPCGCSLLGAMQLSCDHEPFESGVALLGRIADVIAVDGSCAALADGTVVCRGPVAGRDSDSPRVRELVTGGRTGVLHVLETREASSLPSEPEPESSGPT